MPDNKLTDNNIKELLEYKAKAHCELCDLKNRDCCDYCIYTAIKQFIGMFNRLQAALKEWKNIAHKETGYVEIAKAEAYKEFAEKVNQEWFFGALAYAFSDGYGMDNKADIEELSKFLAEKIKKLVGDDT